ncbi:hypothetical protein D915_000390 [Fasciola hepatica]|uniref:C-type lectin domain-containing protein n=1 Tax=Fasciola hepatica TaxID=6192 RepID=A0A4E0S0B7_FASHE|nr:hypothetical protein D915_000390 [Fasciola hepatica]
MLQLRNTIILVFSLYVGPVLANITVEWLIEQHKILFGVPETRQPSRGDFSCAVLTRLALGGAWILNMKSRHLLCPPQYSEACYLIVFNEKKTPMEANELCKTLGLLLWLPVSNFEETVMTSILRSRNIGRIPLRVDVRDERTIMDMEDRVVRHDNFEEMPVFNDGDCFYFEPGSTYWIADYCEPISPFVCVIA